MAAVLWRTVGPALVGCFPGFLSFAVRRGDSSRKDRFSSDPARREFLEFFDIGLRVLRRSRRPAAADWGDERCWLTEPRVFRVVEPLQDLDVCRRAKRRDERSVLGEMIQFCRGAGSRPVGFFFEPCVPKWKTARSIGDVSDIATRVVRRKDKSDEGIERASRLKKRRGSIKNLGTRFR